MQTAKLLTCCLLLALLVALPACTLTSIQTRDDSFAVSESARVEADVDSSRLAVRSGTAGHVRVQATLRHARQTDYQVTQTDDTIAIQVRMQPGFSSKLDRPAVEIILTVPQNTDLDLRSSTGYMYVNDASGHIALTTVAGGIQLSDCEGSMELQNQTGSIACRRVRGSLSIRSDAGKVTLDAVNGVFDVDTNSGAISFEGELAPAEQHRFESTTGIVDLLILGSPDLQVDASSQAGSVRCSLEMSEQVSTKRECKGILGEGTGELQVRTSTGSITIH
jgi:DUF4097 and DUF4098 domain-containing protein YvlB